MINVFDNLNKLPIVLQSERSECGIACIAMISGYFGLSYDISSLRREYDISSTGTTLKNLMEISHSVGFSTRAIRFELESLGQIKLPALLHWDHNHFVVLKSCSNRKICIHDPAVGIRNYNISEADNHITGVALEFEATKEFGEKSAPTTTTFSELLVIGRGFYGSIFQIVLLSVLLQLAMIATPFYIQLVIDQGLANRDPEFLKICGMAFLIISTSKVLVTYLRSMVVIIFSTQLGYQMDSAVFIHLLKLSSDYFNKRQIGDISSRFRSVGAIRSTLVNDISTVLLDGFLAILIFGVMLYYHVWLALLSLSFVLVIALVKSILIPIYRDRQRDYLVTEATLNTNFLETIRTMDSTKVNCGEQGRIAIWQQKFVAFLNRQFRLLKFGTHMELVNNLLTGLEQVAIIYFAGVLVFEGTLTVGMMIGFIFLKSNFQESIVSMIEKLLQLRLVQVEVQRISDITKEEAEVDDLNLSKFSPDIDQSITIQGLEYSFGKGQSNVIENLSIEIKIADRILIRGQSGSGKSTFLRLLMGLIKPNAGSINIDNVSLQQFGIRNFRNKIGAVLQGDQLLAGSISDNVSFFNPDLDFERLVECCKIAEVHDEIVGMPMGYNSVVGDLGSIMSAGQVQRVLLARALYKNPSILILDEALANIDIKTSDNILNNLCKTGKTLILVSHQIDKDLHLFTKRYELYQGKLVEKNLQV